MSTPRRSCMSTSRPGPNLRIWQLVLELRAVNGLGAEGAAVSIVRIRAKRPRSTQEIQLLGWFAEDSRRFHAELGALLLLLGCARLAVWVRKWLRTCRRVPLG